MARTTSKTSRKASKSTSTPEERRAAAEALHERLTASVEALRCSQTWTTYLAVASRLHGYSFNNVLLIMAQCPEATAVAGFRAWQERGRQVRRGEKSIKIFAPCPVRVEVEDTTTGEAIEELHMRFRVASVFDISQTDPIEGMEAVFPVPVDLTGADDAGVCHMVAQWAAQRGYSYELADLGPGHLKGYTTIADGRRVVINSRCEPAMRAATSLHEAAHIALGHMEDDHDEYLAHRGRYEVEAESVAYCLAGMLGMDLTNCSTGYLAHWAEHAEHDVLRSTAAHVLATVHEVTAALEASATVTLAV